MIALAVRALRLATPEERRGLLLSTLAGVVAAAAGTALLALSGYLIARASQAPPVLSLTVAIVAVRGFGVLRAVARYGERLTGHDATLRILARLRAASFAAVAADRSGDRTRGTATGDRIVSDVDGVQDAYLRSLAPIAVAAVVGLAALATAALVLPAAAAVLAGVLLAGAVALPVAAARMARDAATARADVRATLVQDVATALDAAPELVVAGLADRQLRQVRESGARLSALERRSARATALTTAAAGAVGGLGATAVLLVTLPAVRDGALDPVLVGMLALLAMGVGEAIAPLPAAARELRATADAVARVDALLGEAPGRGGTADVAALPAATVVLDGVTVRRGPRTVLRDATLRIGDGERVALVGPSGSGKSTIGELLVDLLPVGAVHGAATIDGRPLDEVDPHVLRRTILHVPQDPYLFDADVRSNLRLALPDADDDALRQALRDAGAGAWLDGLRDGLDTPVGERGGHLSGGERQRIGVARALLAGRRPDGGPRLLVLDEPVSQLPPEEGVALLRRLLDAESSRGALLIAHRDAEAALADRCVTVSAQGRLA